MGSSEEQGQLWSHDPEGWARDAESRLRPLYEAVLARLDVGAGARLLDAGCGSGLALALAVERGARAFGLDAASGLVAFAAAKVPEATVVVGDLEDLPFPDDAFDVVTAFNSVLYAADPRRAIAEVSRVLVAGGHAAITVGIGSDSSLCAAMIDPLLPDGFGASTRTTLNLSDEAETEEAMRAAGLVTTERYELTGTLEFDSVEEAIRAQTAAGTVAAAARESGEEAVDEALRSFFAPKTLSDGSVAMESSFLCTIAAPSAA